MRCILAVVISCTVLMTVALPVAAQLESVYATNDARTGWTGHDDGTGDVMRIGRSRVWTWYGPETAWVGFDTNALLPTYGATQVEGVTLSLCVDYWQSWRITSDSTDVYSAVGEWSDEDYDGVARGDRLVNSHTAADGRLSWELPVSSFAFDDNLSFAVTMDNTYAYAQFYSHEYSGDEFAPRLDVEFAPAPSSESPEPITAVLLTLGLGASALAGRRRKR